MSAMTVPVAQTLRRAQPPENRLRAAAIAPPGAMREQPEERGSIDRPSSGRTTQTAQPCTIVRATTPAADWRLTDRGIAVVMVIAAVILTVALAVIGLAAVRVTSADYGPGVHQAWHDQH